jgi:5-methylcytosine-specific restriction protein B
MVDALDRHNILGKVTEENYGSAYIIAREIGIYFENRDGTFRLSETANAFREGNLSYAAYLRHYLLNLELLIAGSVVHPFAEIAKSLSMHPRSIDGIATSCPGCIPPSVLSGTDKKRALEMLRRFLERVLQSGLVSYENGIYKFEHSYEIVAPCIGRSGLDSTQFYEKFVGSHREKQENIVKDMFGRPLCAQLSVDTDVPTNPVNEPAMNSRPPLNRILYGPPGTGKTDSTVEISLEILGRQSSDIDNSARRKANRMTYRSLLNSRIFFVTMHPSFSYEDFVEGMRPAVSTSGQLVFERKSGIFKRVCEVAIEIHKNRNDENDSVVLILDEINRANISTVFGELITLLEEDKRLGMENELSVTLPSGTDFSVPPNLYIIGTMNTADRSIALVDLALRRRFRFIPLYPDESVVENIGTVDRSEKLGLMNKLNRILISPVGGFFKGVDFQIGHAYFLDARPIANVINDNIIPLLTEYFRNDLVKVKELLSKCGFPADEETFTRTGLLLYK